MTIDQIREVHGTHPFQPYRLQLADGTEISVSHPECVSFHPKHPRSIAIALPNGAFKIIDLLLVAAIHVENGRARRRSRR